MLQEVRRTELVQLYHSKMLSELIASIHDNPEVFDYHSGRALEWYTNMYNALSPYAQMSLKVREIDKVYSNPKEAWEEAFGSLKAPERQRAIKEYMDRNKPHAGK